MVSTSITTSLCKYLKMKASRVIISVLTQFFTIESEHAYAPRYSVPGFSRGNHTTPLALEITMYCKLTQGVLYSGSLLAFAS
jgi:hypothetical protein